MAGIIKSFAVDVIVAASVLLAVPPASAGAVDGVGPETGYRAEILKADSLIKAGRAADAVTLLEDMRAGAPGEEGVTLKLCEALIEAGRPADAAAILEGSLESRESALKAVNLLGVAYIDMGKREKALKTWMDYLEKDAEGSDAKRESVSDLLWEAGFYDEAVDVLKSGGPEDKFYDRHLRKAVKLEKLLGRYRDAFGDEARRLSTVPEVDVRRAGELLGIFRESRGDTSMISMLEVFSDGPNGEFFELMGSALMAEAGRYAEALYRLKSAGSPLPSEPGLYAYVSLLSVMSREERDAGFSDYSEKVYGIFIGRYPRSRFVPSVKLMLAESLLESAVEWPRSRPEIEDALEIASGILDERYGRPYRDRAFILMARIWLEGFDDPAEALKILERPKWDQRGLEKQANMIKAKALSLSPLDGAAMSELEDLASSVDKDVALEAAYRLAENRFYFGEYDKAIESFSELAREHGGSVYANDALHLALLLKKGSAASNRRPLELFASARLERERGRLLEAADTFELIRTDHRQSELTPWAVYEAALLREEAGSRERAVRGLEWLSINKAGHICGRKALESLGDIMAPGSPEEAAAYYRKLIERYPDYPFVTRARNKLERLETEMEGNSGREAVP